MGQTQEQAEDELRQVEPFNKTILQEGYYEENGPLATFGVPILLGLLPLSSERQNFEGKSECWSESFLSDEFPALARARATRKRLMELS